MDIISNSGVFRRLKKESGITVEQEILGSRRVDVFSMVDEDGNSWSGYVDRQDELDDICNLYKASKTPMEFREDLFDYFEYMAESVMTMDEDDDDEWYYRD